MFSLHVNDQRRCARCGQPYSLLGGFGDYCAECAEHEYGQDEPIEDATVRDPYTRDMFGGDQ